MAKMTIKEMRERDAVKMAQRLSAEPTPAEIEAARHALRLFYKFGAAYLNSFYIDNDRSATERQIAAADAKEDKAYKKAAEALKPYNLKICCPGLYPVIDELNGCNFTYGHYYN